MVASLGGFHRKGGIDVPVADGGTGASTASAGLAGLGHASEDHAGILGVGKFIKRLYVQTSAVSSTTGQYPDDDTLPLAAEGAAIPGLSIAIAPSNSANFLKLTWSVFVSPNAGAACIVALLKSGNGSVSAMTRANKNTSSPAQISGSYFILAGGTSSQTWSLRYGTVNSTLTCNGVAGARRYSTAIKSFFSIEEYAPN